MKKLLFLLLLIPSLAYGAAGDVASINGKAITAVSSVAGISNAAILTIGGKPCADGDTGCTCGTAGNSCAGADPSNVPMCYYADRRGLAQEFTASATGTVCKATLRLRKDGDTGNNPTLQACIYSDASDTPNAIIGTCSTNTYNVNSLTTSFASIDFTGMSASISSGTKYHIALFSSAQCTTDLMRWGMVETGCDTGSLYFSFGDGTPTWTKQSTSAGFEFVLTLCN